VRFGLTVKMKGANALLTDAALKNLKPKDKPYKVTGREVLILWKPVPFHSSAFLAKGFYSKNGSDPALLVA
jgi:hypothetical protein